MWTSLKPDIFLFFANLDAFKDLKICDEEISEDKIFVQTG